MKASFTTPNLGDLAFNYGIDLDMLHKLGVNGSFCLKRVRLYGTPRNIFKSTILRRQFSALNAS